MFLLDSFLVGLIAIAVLREKQTSNTEQAELIPVPVEENSSTSCGRVI